MDIWLLNPYGPIPGEGWRDYRFTLVARALAARGHRVTWWTAAFSHQSKRLRSPEFESRDAGDFTINLVPTTAYTSHIGVARLRFEHSFAQEVLRRGRLSASPAVIVAADPPQFCGAAGRKLARHHGTRLVIDCVDLWPELFISVSPPVLRPFVAAAVQPLFAIRRRNTRAAALVIAAADTYRHVAEREGARRSVTIPIGVDRSLFQAVPREAERNDLRSPGETTVRAVYAGTLGEAYDLETVIRAASMLDRAGAPIELVIAGSGPAEPRLRRLATSVRAANVRFAGLVAATSLPAFYAEANVGLAPYAASSTVALPLKLFDYFAAGLPVITSLGGEAAETVASAGAGLFYEPGNASSLRDALLQVAGDTALRRSLSEAARAASAQFDSAALYEQYASEIEAVASA